jgi:hypothetical protein
MEDCKKALLTRLEDIWTECRVEIRQRVTQRDQYFLRMYVSIAAVLAIAFLKGIPLLLAILPGVAAYFCVLIAHSYKIHYALANYLRDDIEVKIKKLLCDEEKIIKIFECHNCDFYSEIEEMFSKKELTGARKWIYERVTYFVSIIAILLMPLLDFHLKDMSIVIISSIICCWYWYHFYNKYMKNNNSANQSLNIDSGNSPAAS